MAKRIVFGVIMIAVLAGLLYLDWRLEDHDTQPDPLALQRAQYPSPLYALPITLVLTALVLVGFEELKRLAAAEGVALLPTTGRFLAVVLVSYPYWGGFLETYLKRTGAQLPCDPILIALCLGLAALFLEQMARGRTEQAIRRIGGTLLVALYLGIGCALILSIRHISLPAVVLFASAVKFTDIGAYFTGTAIGKHKIIPWLSPGKSWEGLAGGLVFAAGISIVIARTMGISELSNIEAAIFGVIVGLVGQFADICESLLKRSAAIKDSGALVPEFGGVLDLIDSPLLSAPVALILLAIML